MRQKTHDKIQSLVDNMTPELKSKLIYNDNGQYVLFDLYRIIVSNDIYLVKKLTSDDDLIFGSLRTATAWCVLDNYNKIIPARRIIELDKQLSSNQVDKTIHGRLQKQKNNVNREIYRDKMLYDLSKQMQLRRELDKYIIMANICQQRGFKNELTRTS